MSLYQYYDNEQEIREKRNAMLKAYKIKSRSKEEVKMATLERIRSESTIVPLSPIRCLPEKRIEHRQSVTFGRYNESPPRIHNKWWTKQPCIAGEALTRAQKRNCNSDLFPESYKNHFRDDRAVALANNNQFVVDKIEATKTLASLPFKQLIALNKTADFYSEVNFRTALRRYDSSSKLA